jgi:hypothetical protein
MTDSVDSAADSLEPGSLQFEVTHARTSTWLWTILDGLSGTVGPNNSTVSRYPEVAVYNWLGVRRVLEVTDTDEQAEERADVVQDDFETLSLDEWCDRYDVPSSFVTG